MNQATDSSNQPLESDSKATVLVKKRPLSRLAWLLDDALVVPFLNRRIGLDSIIGLVPGLGDVAGAAISSWIVLQGVRMNVPKLTLMRMLMNIGVEVMVGSVPIVGDVFDMAWKANRRNVTLLDDYLDQPQETARGSALMVMATCIGLLAVAMATTMLGFKVLISIIAWLGTSIGGLI